MSERLKNSKYVCPRCGSFRLSKEVLAYSKLNLLLELQCRECGHEFVISADLKWIYDGYDAEASHSPKRLNIVEFCQTRWFVDLRLEEFRNICKPHDRIPFHKARKEASE